MCVRLCAYICVFTCMHGDNASAQVLPLNVMCTSMGEQHVSVALQESLGGQAGRQAGRQFHQHRHTHPRPSHLKEAPEPGQCLAIGLQAQQGGLCGPDHLWW